MNTQARDNNNKRSCCTLMIVPHKECPLSLRAKISICVKCNAYFSKILYLMRKPVPIISLLCLYCITYNMCFM